MCRDPVGSQDPPHGNDDDRAGTRKAQRGGGALRPGAADVEIVEQKHAAALDDR